MQPLDEQRLNGIVAWNMDLWLTPRFKSSLVGYLSGRPKPKIPKRETPNSIQTPLVPYPECDRDYK